MNQLKEEINEKIPKKTQKVIIYLVSLLAVVLVGLLVFKPMLEEAQTNKKEVEKLEKEVSELKKLDAAKETNKKNAERYESDTKTILAKYPSDVFPEDMIVTLSNLETQTGILFTDLEVQNNNYVTENNDKTSSSQATRSSSSSSSSSKSSSSTSTSSSNSSNSSSSNSSSNSSNSSASNSSSNSSNSSANSSSSNSSSNSSNSSSNASKANGTTTTSTSGTTAVVSSESYDLYVTPVDCAFEVSYTGIKQLFSALFASPLKKNVENVSLSYDQDTGRLMGTMTINFYTMQYKDNTVNGHEAMPGVNKGTANIFHSIN